MPVGRVNVASSCPARPLKFLRESGCPWDTWTAYAAARGGLDILKYVREQGCAWDAWTPAGAAKVNNLSVLMWARGRRLSLGRFDYPGGGLAWAPRLPFKYATENGCPMNKWTCARAARGGHLGCLRFAREHGCEWDGMTTSWAALGNHLEVLEYAYENGCPIDEESSSAAAEGENLDVFRWLREHGCPWNETTCSEAAGGAHLRF